MDCVAITPYAASQRAFCCLSSVHLLVIDSVAEKHVPLVLAVLLPPCTRVRRDIVQKSKRQRPRVRQVGREWSLVGRAEEKEGRPLEKVFVCPQEGSESLLTRKLD